MSDYFSGEIEPGTSEGGFDHLGRFGVNPDSIGQDRDPGTADDVFNPFRLARHPRPIAASIDFIIKDEFSSRSAGELQLELLHIEEQEAELAQRKAAVTRALEAKQAEARNHDQLISIQNYNLYESKLDLVLRPKTSEDFVKYKKNFI